MITLILLASLLTFESDSLEVRFIGNAGAELFDGETTVLVDLPYQSGAYGYMEYRFDSILARGTVVSAITHRHADHFDPTLLRKTDWQVFAPAEVSRSFPQSRVLADSSHQVGAFTLTKMPTPHGDTEHYSLLIQWRKVRLYFSGDTEDSTQLLAMPDLDVLFTTPWLSCIVERTGHVPEARRTILYHHLPDNRNGSCGFPEVPQQGESFFIYSD